MFFFVVGAVGAATLTHVPPGGSPVEPPGALNYWAHWDGGWYSAIADEGYFNAASTTFFPLYPFLLAVPIRAVGGAAIWGVVLSTLFLLFALYFVYRIAEDGWGRPTARAATLAIGFFPSAFFFNAVYSESLFVLATAGAVWAVRVRRSFLLACVFAYFAMVTRNVGVFILIPLAAEWWRRRRELDPIENAAFVLAPAGLAAWMLFLWRARGDPLSFAVAQRESWGRAFTNPATTVAHAWTHGTAAAKYAFHPEVMFRGHETGPAFLAADTFNLILAFVCLALLVVAFVRLPLALAVYSLALVVAPILTPSPFWPLTSFSRYLLAPFPLFIALGTVLSRSRVVLAAWVVVSAAFGAYLTLLFVTWRWVA